MRRIPTILISVTLAASVSGSGLHSPEDSPKTTRPGIVVDERGKPVSGALVWFTSNDGDPGRIPFDAGANLTDKRGGFDLRYPESLSNNDLYVHAFAPGNALTTTRVAPGSAPIVIRLTSSIRIEGVIRDLDGHSLSGVAVVARPVSSIRAWPASAFENEPPDAVLTSAGGHYSIPVQQGTWKIAAFRSGWLLASSKPIHVAASRVVAEPIHLSCGSWLFGRVLTSDGEGVAGARVSLSDDFHNLRTISDRAGRFALSPVAAGMRGIEVLSGRVYLYGEIEAGPNAEPATLVLPPMNRVSGTVRDAGELPIPDALIQLVSTTSSSPRLITSSTTRTDPAGNFQLDDVPAGEIIVVASTPELVPHWTTPRTWSGAMPLQYDIRLQGGVALTGRVIDDSGQPVTARVRVQTDPQRIQQSHFYDTDAMTDSDGRYRIERIAPGRRTVTIDAECCIDQTKAILFRSSNERLDITLSRGGQISGRVTDLGGNPVDGVSVTATQKRPSESQARSTRPESDGAYHFSGLEPGPWTISVEHPALIAPEIISEPGDSNVDFLLTQGASIYGTVTGIGGRSNLTARSNRRGQTITTRISNLGEYELEGLPAGLLELSLQSGLHRIPLRSITAKPPERLRLDFDLETIGAATGRILVNRSPATHASFYWSGEHGTGSSSSDARGMLKATGLADGHYRAWIGGRGLGSVQTTVDVRNGQFEIVLEGAPAIVRVIDSNGFPVSDALVRFGPVEGVSRQTERSHTSDGLAEVTFLPRGPFRLWIEYAGWFSEVEGNHRPGQSPSRYEIRLARP